MHPFYRRCDSYYPALQVLPRGAGVRIDMDLVALQRHLTVRHLHQLRIEQRRKNISRRRRDRHIEQPRLADEATKPAALVPILNNEVAGVPGRFGDFFCGQRDAVPI